MFPIFQYFSKLISIILSDRYRKAFLDYKSATVIDSTNSNGISGISRLISMKFSIPYLIILD